MPHFAFCQNCGNRVPLSSGDAVRQFCGHCATPAARKQQKEDQARLEAERHKD